MQSFSVSTLVGSHTASRDGPSTSLTDTNTVTIKSQSYTTPGDSATAAALAAEADALTDATGSHRTSIAALLLTALTGNEPNGSRAMGAAIELARAPGQGLTVQIGLWANAVLCNGLAQYEQALSLALQASEEPLEFIVGPWALPELIEAAVRTGHETLAAEALKRVRDSTDGIESDWARGTIARCKALVHNGQAAEQHYRESVECFSRTAIRPELGRAHLLYGEWLRREKRRMDARAQLRTAYDMFTEIGMLAFAERALRELQATGETVRKRREETRSDLTPQEEQIARLAVEGRTNAEIGAQLYISARTVEWHLRKLFMKLGITSRRGLQNALAARTGNRGRN